MEMNRPKHRLSRGCYLVLRWILKLVYPSITVEGAEHLPQEPCIIVGNHAQMHGPVIAELYLPGKRTIWCNAQMMELREVPAYTYQDFWSKKPRYIRWFFKLSSYLIAPLCVLIFRNAHTTAVYHDARVMRTFRDTVKAMQDGSNVVIFPECYEPHNHIVNQFQEHFIDVAKLYCKRTGQAVSFVPMYVAPRAGKVRLGEPVFFCPDAPIGQERSRICNALMDEITRLAMAMPVHKVVPYENRSPKDYVTNLSSEVDAT
ncbi:MAG: hypothetical protein PUB51_07455 [Oscillospiraceae bacterium]|nr:hypothetical protein [Oscillospiraceae bacterium]